MAARSVTCNAMQVKCTDCCAGILALEDTRVSIGAGSSEHHTKSRLQGAPQAVLNSFAWRPACVIKVQA